MSPWIDLKLLLLLGVANGTPVVAQKILGHRLSYPLDCHARFGDGQPILGAAKSIRGVVLSLAATTIAAPCVGLTWSLGSLVAALAMSGDLFSSFLKRRLRYPSSSMALGLDQMPESLFPLMGVRLFLPLSLGDIAAVLVVFFLGELVLSRALFRLRLRDRPY